MNVEWLAVHLHSVIVAGFATAIVSAIAEGFHPWHALVGIAAAVGWAYLIQHPPT